MKAAKDGSGAMRKALLLVGSPRGAKSASRMLGGYLMGKLEAGGMETAEMTAAAALQSTENQHRTHKAVDAAELVVVAFPLYVDGLPAPLVQALELIADRRKGSLPASPVAGPRVQRVAAVVQCGFPEARQNEAALAIVRQFAKEAGFEWAGGLAMGMGGAVTGKPLDKAGGMVRNVVKALDLAAAALLEGRDIPEEAAALMGKRLMPTWLYTFMGNRGMKRSAKKHGVLKRANARPYE
ncbi:MAG: hypothetical protein FJY79_11460 [Candidatus Aminicenantes bacterium]|nr:hypothetical protein [Candidatus Aminicenantes bacterium]